MSVVVVALAAMLAAAQPESFDAGMARARELFEDVRYHEALAVTDALLALPDLSIAKRVEALQLQAFCLYLLSLYPEAKRAWLTLLQVKPRHVLDPVRVSPELRAFFGRVEPEQLTQPSATAAPYEDLTQREVTPSRHCGGWCWLPFGTGQYLNGRPGKGALFTTLEVLSLGANVGLYWARVSDYDQRGYFEDPDSARTSYKLQAATLGVFAVALIAGVIDAYVFP